MTKQTKHRLGAVLAVFTAISISGIFPVVSMADAVTTETIWSDGFESNDFSEWDTPVGPQWEVNTGSVTGFRAGAMTADTEGTDSALEKSQSTAGFEHIKLTYWYKAIDFSPTDALRLEYTADGATWIPLSTINKGLDDHVIREVTATLPASTDDNEDFALRFIGKINGSGAEVWIDDVVLSGDIIGSGDTGTGTTTTATTTPSGTGTTTPPSTETGTTTSTSTTTTTGSTTPPVSGTTTPPTTSSPEGSYLTCNDGIDNDLDGATDVADIECILFRPTATVMTQVIGGTATASDFLFKVLFGTTPSATTTGSTTGVDMTWPYVGTWQVVPLPMPGYNTAFSQDCAPSGFFAMLFNTHKNCLLINTFGTATTTATSTTTGTGGATSTSTTATTTDGAAGNTGTTTATSTTTGTGTTGTTTATSTNSTTSTTGTTTTTTGTGTTTGGTTTGAGITPPACADGSDNDGDGLADLNDPGCTDSLDNSEVDTLVGVITPPPTSGATTSATSTDETIEGGEVLGASTSTVATSSEPMCIPLLTKYLRPWGHNDSDEVKKLQGFLRDHEGEYDLAETGFFGHATRAAVERFQLKYGDDILSPWLAFGHRSIHTATGIVYKMSLWKINALYCENVGAPVPEVPQIP